MKNWRNTLPKGKAIDVLLVFALFFSVVSQVHIHQIDSHEHETIEHAEHSHAKDFHASFDDSHPVNHSEIQVINLQPDASLKYKNTDMQDQLLAVLLVLLVFIPLLERKTRKLFHFSNKRKLHRYYNFPVSRAPPFIA